MSFSQRLVGLQEPDATAAAGYSELQVAPHPTPYTLHLTPYTLQPTPNTLHPTPNPTPYALHPGTSAPPTTHTLHPWFHHPGGNPGANLKSIYHRCHPMLVAFVWDLTE